MAKTSWRRLRLSSWFIVCFLLTGCQHQFACLNCHAPDQSPVIYQNTMTDLQRADITLMPKGESLKAIIPTDDFFLTNKPTIKTDKFSALKLLADTLKRYGNASVKVIGYTDSVQDDKTQETLSLARARAVLVYLWSQGLDAEHLYAVGLGESDPVGDFNNVDANGANRRIEVIVHAHCTTCF